MDDETRERLLAEAEKEENKRPIKGATAVTYEKDGQVRTGFETNVKGGKPGWHNPGTLVSEIERPDKPEKRTGVQQATSLGSRIWDAAQKNPAEMQKLLQRLQGYFWEQGKPCSFEEVQRLAGELLAKAEQDVKATRS